MHINTGDIYPATNGPRYICGNIIDKILVQIRIIDDKQQFETKLKEYLLTRSFDYIQTDRLTSSAL